VKKKSFLVLIILVTAAVVPLIAFNAQAIISAGPDQTVQTGQAVNLNGTTTDNSTLINQITWNFGDNSTIVNGTSPALLNATHIYNSTGVYNATLTVKFGGALNKTETANVQITVQQNLPPVANAGPDQKVQQNSPQGANVTLNGLGSSDPNNDTLSYFWTWNGGNASGAVVTKLFPAGNTTVTLRVTDGQFNATDTVNIVVEDTTPPQLSVVVSPSILWSPNHQSVEVKVNANASDLVDPSPKITLVSVKSNEPDNGVGDGNTTGDIVIINDFTFNLNAERSGTGSGRIYTITYRATDAAGNTATASATVTVPHNQ
jgi:hypothetical protein